MVATHYHKCQRKNKSKTLDNKRDVEESKSKKGCLTNAGF